jgi:hypothetical protein
MYKLTFWASRHVGMTRVIIALLSLWLLAAAMILAGFAQSKSSLPNVRILLLAGMLAIAASVLCRHLCKLNALRPLKQIRFLVGRTRFIFFGLGCFLFSVAFFSSGMHLRVNNYTALQGSFAPSEKAELKKPQYDQYTDKNAYYNDLKGYYKSLSNKALRKELKDAFKQQKSGDTGGVDVLLIVVTILGALAALYLVAALSCSLSCNGNDGMAVLVAVLGIAGIVAGAVAIFNGAHRRKLKRLETEAEPE